LQELKEFKEKFESSMTVATPAKSIGATTDKETVVEAQQIMQDADMSISPAKTENGLQLLQNPSDITLSKMTINGSSFKV
jgi:hypothetical protein